MCDCHRLQKLNRYCRIWHGFSNLEKFSKQWEPVGDDIYCHLYTLEWSGNKLSSPHNRASEDHTYSCTLHNILAGSDSARCWFHKQIVTFIPRQCLRQRPDSMNIKPHKINSFIRMCVCQLWGNSINKIINVNELALLGWLTLQLPYE